jgi:large subunit ribosomal protein L22
MGYRASHRSARISPRKVGLVMDMIRGKPLEEALRAVDFSPRRASRMVAKLLRSALANADEQEADLELLYVVDARADQGPVLKRV